MQKTSGLVLLFSSNNFPDVESTIVGELPR